MIQKSALLQLMVCVLLDVVRAQFPFPMGAPMPLAAPAPPHGPLPGPLPVPMHMPVAVRHHQVPVVVMPYRSKSADRVFKKKKRRKPVYYSSSSISSDTSRSDTDFSASPEYKFRGRKRRQRRKKKREVLTPVISYLTRKGRVVYQKKIKKDNPSDWLTMGKQQNSLEQNSLRESGVRSAEMTVRDLKRKYKLRKRKRKNE